MTKLIIENAILPRFRAGDFAGGIKRGTDDIIQVASGDAEEYKHRAAQRPENVSGGIDFATVVFVAIVILVILLAHPQRHGRWPARRAPPRRVFRTCDFIPSGRLVVVGVVLVRR